MDIQHIPKTFWHALSIAILIVSSGLTYIAYRSSNVSIELANAKINLSSEVASSTIALKSALDEAKEAKAETERKYDALIKQHELLQSQLRVIESQALSDNSAKLSLEKLKESCPTCLNIKPLPKSLPFATFDKNIIRAQQSLDKLETLNKQIQPMQ